MIAASLLDYVRTVSMSLHWVSRLGYLSSLSRVSRMVVMIYCIIRLLFHDLFTVIGLYIIIFDADCTAILTSSGLEETSLAFLKTLLITYSHISFRNELTMIIHGPSDFSTFLTS